MKIIKRSRRSQLRDIFLLLTIIILVVVVLQHPSLTGFSTVFSQVSSCAAEDLESVPGTFGDPCDATDGSLVQTNDGSVETHFAGKTGSIETFAGLRIETVSTAITNCALIDRVAICYEWWSDGNVKNCDISVDADGSASYTLVTADCPGTNPNPGVTCTDVTLNETWACSNFFGALGTRAVAKSEATKAGGGDRTISWDVFYFNVTYIVSDTSPPASVTNLQNSTATTTSIFWSWTHPSDADFDSAIIFINGDNVANTSDDFYNATDLTSDTTYTITVHTKDISGNVNNTDVTSIAKTLPVIDTEPPQYSNLQETPTDPATYTPGQIYTFLATWTDDTAVDTVILEFNGVNYTDLVQNGNVHSKTFADFSSGTYNYRWYANDTSGNTQNTEVLTYTINKAASAVNLLLDGIDGNIAVEVGSTVNLTAASITGESIIDLYKDGTLINSGKSPLTSQVLIDTFGTVNITAVYPATQNYTASSETHYITMQDTTPPSSVTNLSNQFATETSIFWNWTNPVDVDFSQALVYVNGDNVANTSNNFYNATALTPDTTYTITVHTKDTSGNINNGDVNSTAKTNAPSPFCGDAVCNNGETCSSCAQDCGACPAPPAPSASSGGGGGFRTTARVTCEEQWTCTAWTECEDGIQTRSCTDENNCGTSVNKPIETNGCEEPCQEAWTCTKWSECSDGKQTRTCSDNNNCGTTWYKPAIQQTCLTSQLEGLPSSGAFSLSVGKLGQTLTGLGLLLVLISTFLIFYYEKFSQTSSKEIEYDNE